MGENENMSQRRRKEVSLLGIFGKERLDSLLKNLSDATDFSFSIIDYKGEAVTESRIQNDFCKNRKNAPAACKECQISSAFAAAKAAIKCCPYLFRCPGGLVNFAVPVIVKDQYIGAVIGGWVRCNDEEAQKVYQEIGDMDEDARWKKELPYQTIPEVSYRKISAISDLVFSLLKEMGEKETCGLQLAALEHKEIHLKDIREKNASLQKELQEKNLENMKARILPQFHLNLLVTISNFSIIENALKTEEVISELASVLRYYIDETDDWVNLGYELAQIEVYLKVLKKQYENRLNYRMKYQEEDVEQKIPVLSIFPFIGYVINFGVLPNNFKGTIYIDVEIIRGKCLITIQLESPDFLGNNWAVRNSVEKIMDADMIMSQISNTKKRLAYAYGDKCKVVMQPNLVAIELPADNFDGEVER